jgi:hypothetical protein
LLRRREARSLTRPSGTLSRRERERGLRFDTGTNALERVSANVSPYEGGGLPGRERVCALIMQLGPRISIAALMRLIALFAIELAMFQRVLFLIVIPPISMAVVSLNLAVLYAFRWLPSSMSQRIAGLLSGGLISIFVLVGYYVMTGDPHNPAIGIVGKVFGAYLSNLAASSPDPGGGLAAFVGLAARSAQVAEVILLDLVGLAIVWFGGWMDSRRHTGPVAPEASAS